MHIAAILATWLMFPLASFIATILERVDNLIKFSGVILRPVLPGTLYTIIGVFTELLIASKCLNNPLEFVLL